MSLGVDEIEGILSAHERMPTGASFPDGIVFGSWRVTAFLGKGGNGEVYRVVHVSLGTSAALKIFVRDEPRARERFMREAKLLSELKSASFPQFLEYGEANGCGYLVMELLEPGDLPSGDREVVRFLRQICEAVAEFHVRGIVHRDIKPNNILITRDGHHVKLIDFGLADKDDFDILKEPAGTTAFASPEQQKRNKIDNRSDIYALGKIIQDISYQSFKIKRITKKCLEENPEKRFSSALEVKKKLNSKTDIIILIITLLLIIFTFFSLILVNMKNKIETLEIMNNEMVTQEFYDSLKKEIAILENENHKIKSESDSIKIILKKQSETENLYKSLHKQVVDFAGKQCREIEKTLDYNNIYSPSNSNKISNLILSRGKFPQQLIDSNLKKDSPYYHEWLHNLKKVEENIYTDFSRSFYGS